MTALDADILSDYFAGRPDYVARIRVIPEADLFVPAVVAEEILRGRLDQIRRAEARRDPALLEQAYHSLVISLVPLGRVQLLPFTTAAEAVVQQWRAARIRVGTRDMRIGATCVVHGATLVTRNGGDFRQLPGLSLDVWT